MNKALDVHTAELITAAVEVKTLTIRGKQVTLAVFRQLEETPLVLDDGSLAGIPWGRVNYHPDKCADDKAHMHVVWQQGTELRRARVKTNPWFSVHFSEACREYCSIQYALLQLGVENQFWSRQFGTSSSFNLLQFPDVEIEIRVHRGLLNSRSLPGVEAYKQHADGLARLLQKDPGEYENTYATLEERIGRVRGYCASAIDDAHEAALVVHEYLFNDDRLSLDEAREALRVEVAAEHARRERIRAATAMLAGLSQLFIAV